MCLTPTVVLSVEPFASEDIGACPATSDPSTAITRHDDPLLDARHAHLASASPPCHGES